MYTSHGHHIQGSVVDTQKPDKIARCGGPGLCETCSVEASQILIKGKSQMIQPLKYVRKPFEVDAVEVTEDNMQEVAEWCQGTVHDIPNGRPFIKVRVARALNERQTKAFVGDWVLYAGIGFKVYTKKAFNRSFEPDTRESVVDAGELETIELDASEDDEVTVS